MVNFVKFTLENSLKNLQSLMVKLRIIKDFQQIFYFQKLFS